MAEKNGNVLVFPNENITEPPKTKRPVSTLKTAVSVILALFIICCVSAVVILSNDKSSGFVYRFANFYSIDKSEKGLHTVYDYQADSSNNYGVLENALILATQTDIILYNRNGLDVFSKEVSMQAPRITSREKTAAVFEPGGTKLYAFTGIRDIMEYTSQGEILSVAIGSSGHIVVTSRETGYKSAVSVYDNSGGLLYNCGYSSGYVTAAAISHAGKYLAAALTYQEKGTVYSRVDLYATDASGAKASYSIEDELIISLSFIDQNTLCLVGENKLILLNAGTLEYLSTYAYDGMYLKNVSFDVGGRVILLLNHFKGGGKCSLVSVDSTGQAVGVYVTESDVTSMSAKSGTVAILEDTRLVTMDRDLNVTQVLHDLDGYKKVLVRADSGVILIGSSEAALYTP